MKLKCLFGCNDLKRVNLKYIICGTHKIYICKNCGNLYFEICEQMISVGKELLRENDKEKRK